MRIHYVRCKKKKEKKLHTKKTLRNSKVAKGEPLYCEGALFLELQNLHLMKVHFKALSKCYFSFFPN